MSTELIEIAQQIKEREKLVQEARQLVKRNQTNMSQFLKKEGISEEFIEIARQNLTSEQKKILEDMHRQVSEHITKIADERYGDKSSSILTGDLKETRESESSVPLDALLKGNKDINSGKKLKKKKKKNWA